MGKINLFKLVFVLQLYLNVCFDKNGTRHFTGKGVKKWNSYATHTHDLVLFCGLKCK